MNSVIVLSEECKSAKNTSDFVKTTELARLAGCSPARVRQIVIENQEILLARKNHGAWEVALEAIPLIAPFLKEAGAKLNTRTFYLCEEVGALRRQVFEMREENHLLKAQTEELNNRLVEAAEKSKDASEALAIRALDVARTVAESPKQESGEKDDSSWAFKLGPLDGKVPPALVPIIAVVAIFGAGMWVRNLQAKKESEFLDFAGEQIQTTMKTIEDARQSAERSLVDEKKRLAEKEKSLKESEAQQKDISDQLTEKKIEVAKLGTMTRDLETTIKSLNEQIDLLEMDRTRRESLEKELQATLAAQKTVTKSQEDVIAAQKSELEALKKQLPTFTSSSAEPPKSGGGETKSPNPPLASK